MAPPPDFSSLSSADKEALIRALLARVDALIAENAALRERLNLPAKTPDNSSMPPSQGHKASGESETKPKAKAHAGSHRPLHPNPTRRRDILADHCEHCRAAASGSDVAAGGSQHGPWPSASSRSRHWPCLLYTSDAADE